MEGQHQNLYHPKPIFFALQPQIILYPDGRGQITGTDLSQAVILDLAGNLFRQDQNLLNLQQIFSNLQEARPKIEEPTTSFLYEVNNQNANQAVDFLTDPKKKVLLRKVMKEMKVNSVPKPDKKPAKPKQSSKKTTKVSSVEADRIAKTLLNTYQQASNVTIDQKIDAILAKKSSQQEILSSGPFQEELPRKKVKIIKNEKTPEEELIGLNVQRERLSREKKLQSQENAEKEGL